MCHDKEHKVRASEGVTGCYESNCAGVGMLGRCVQWCTVSHVCVSVLFSVLFWLWQFSLRFFGSLFLYYSILKYRIEIETHRIFSDLGCQVVAPILYFGSKESFFVATKSFR